MMHLVSVSVCALAALTAVATAQPVELVVGMPPATATAELELERLFWAVATPGNPEYGRFRSVGELRTIIGASAGSIAAARAYLTAAGADETVVSPLGDHVVGRFGSLPAARLVGGSRFGHGLAADCPASIAAMPYADFVLRRDAQQPSGGSDLEQTHRVQRAAAGDRAGAMAPGGAYAVGPVKKAFAMPTDLKATNDSTLQMVWGPGTFGYSPSQLLSFKLSQCPELDMKKISFDTPNHGHEGDNFGEGNLDVSQIAAYGLDVQTLVSNTNTSASTEEGSGFGQALLDFVLELPTRTVVPQVLSISLGSLSPASCELLCVQAVAMGHSAAECQAFMQEQRQVCMYISTAQTAAIDRAFKLLALRGVSVFGSSGDGGSHWSFEPFPSGTALGRDLNTIGCKFQFPVYPTGSPYVTSVGGIDWGAGPSDPVAWSGSGGGFAWQFGRPAHQDEAVAAYLSSAPGLPPAGSYNGTARAYPDLAAISVEGTSQSSPQLAGIFSMITDARLNAGLPPLGFLGPRLYATARQYPGEAFTDITSGNTKTNCDNGFAATKGWDPVTGFGSPHWPGLLKHFGSDTTLV